MPNNPPNLRKIEINKTTDFDKGNILYTKLSIEALDNALLQLNSEGAIKLYVYLVKNINGYNLLLYSSTFKNSTRLGQTAYRTGFKELVDKGFLKKISKDNYVFYDMPPQEQEQPINIQINKSNNFQNNLSQPFTF